MHLLKKFEYMCRYAGVVLIALYIGATSYRSASSYAEVKHFKVRQTALTAPQRLAPSTPNFDLWSNQRIKNYKDVLNTKFAASAVGILRIAKIEVEAPILEGTDTLSLNRGVGHVTGTANPGEDGNVVIAGHRDGFFRGLKDISVGDAVEVASLHEHDTYIVDRIIVVDPSDISVLQRRERSSLTLITCYPFHYIGWAPKRYVVQASLHEGRVVDIAQQGSGRLSVAPASDP